MRCNNLQKQGKRKNTSTTQKKKTYHITMNKNIIRIWVILKTQPTKGKHHHKQHHEQ